MNRAPLTLLSLPLLVISCAHAAPKAAPPESAAQVEAPKSAPTLHAPKAFDTFASCVAKTCTFVFDSVAERLPTKLQADRCVPGTPPCSTNQGVLSSEAGKHVTELAAKLAADPPAELEGCPGCADGPIYVLTLVRPDGTHSLHRFDPLNVPPELPLLVEAYGLMAEAESAVASCQANATGHAIDECVPRH